MQQLELNEFDGCSLLASTMVWDDSMSYTFERAVYMAESHIHQVNAVDNFSYTILEV